jgi:hypothetical protein
MGTGGGNVARDASFHGDASTRDATTDGRRDMTGTDASISGVRVTGSTLPCDSSGWCWVHPLPQGNTLRAVLERSPNDVWAAGDYGVVLHWDGTAWTHFRLGTGTGMIMGLAAEPSGAVWAVGENGLAARYDGTAFTVTDTGTTTAVLYGVATGSSGEVYAAGSGGTLLSWDGAHWGAVTGLRLPIPDSSQTRPETRDLLSVWVSRTGDVWVGGAGVLWLGQAGTWSTVSGAKKSYVAISGAPPSEVWFTTSDGIVLRWNGTGLTSMLVGNGSAAQLWVGGASDVWICRYSNVQHWDGTQWTSLTLPYSAHGLSGVATNDVWAAGDVGSFMRWNGKAWAAVSTPGLTVPSQLPYGVGALWVSAPNDVWLADVVGGLYHYDGISFTPYSARAGKRPITTFWGAAANDIWSFGQAAEITHWNGTQWTLAQNTGGNDFTDGRGSSSTDVWAVGVSGNVYHYDGTSWSLQNQGLGGISLQTIYAPAPGVAWAGALDGYLMRWDGHQWSQDTSVPLGNYTSGITLIWGTGTSNVYEFGATGTYHYDGQAWSPLSISWGGSRAWGSGPNDLWVVNVGGVGHFDGTGWTGLPTDTQLLYAIGGSAPDDAWLGGQQGLKRRQPSP